MSTGELKDLRSEESAFFMCMCMGVCVCPPRTQHCHSRQRLQRRIQESQPCSNIRLYTQVSCLWHPLRKIQGAGRWTRRGGTMKLWRSLKRSQSQRTMCCWIPLIRNVQERPMGGNRKQIHGCLRPAGARGWEAMAGRVQAFFLV